MADNNIKSVEITYEDEQKKQLDGGFILLEVDGKGGSNLNALNINTVDLVGSCSNLLDCLKKHGLLGFALRHLIAKFGRYIDDPEDTEDTEDTENTEE